MASCNDIGVGRLKFSTQLQGSSSIKIMGSPHIEFYCPTLLHCPVSVVNDRLCPVRLTREDANRSLAKSVIAYDITVRIRLSQPASATHDVGFAVSMAGAVAVMRE